MKKYILKSLFVSVLCMLAASCQDTEFAEAVDSSKAQVMFSIAMDSPAARSRANWGQDYSQTSDLGDEYDNRIDLDQFIVKIEADGKTYNVTDIIKWKDGESNEHKFVGIVKTQNDENVGDITLQKAKISVYANMGTDANANFASMTFDQDAENIPMWGALTVENLKFAPGKRTSVDDIYLLRAMAKFQVTLGDAAIEKGYTLTKASLNKFNLTGFNMPTGYAGAESTMALDMEGVLNENTTNPAGGVTELTEATEDGKGWVIYLPEISNTTASELKMLLTFSNGSNEKIETEVSVKDYTTANKDLVNIVRNHWYKYVIEDIVNAQPVVKYETLDWETININVGGEGFLALSTDLVEIYNANTGQLKFTSSSPITIVRADVYEHKRNGEIVKRQKINDVDPVDAYYVNKFGVLTQLPTDESNPESVILANTSAVVDGEDSEVLNGSITINSPFIGDATATEDLLKNDSHDNTIRYLEFLVTNEDDLSATFRVMQYPPVVITNQEGYFSYREDMRIADLPHYYYQDQFRFPFGQNMPIDNGEATHYKNPIAPFFCVAGFFKYNEIEWNNETNRVIKQDSKVLYEEGLYGLMERDYHRVDAYKNNGISGVYHRTHVLWENGKAYPDDSSSNYDDTGDYYQNVGPVYLKEETGKYYRRHYTGQSYNFFFSKFVGEVHEDGKATIHKQMPNVNGPDDPKPIWNQWASMGAYFNYHANHRMYHIRVTNTSINYTIGWPIMEVEDGRTYTAEGEKNSMTVSPSFMVASQLGEAIVPKSDQYYTVPAVEGMYEFAKRQCEQYAEAFYEDIDNDGYTPGTDPITHYSDWRLPTRAELGIINYYQQHSRAMDLVLTGDSYFCASVTPLVYSSNTVLYDRRTNTEGNLTNYHMRCVRDVKPGQKLLKKIYPI